jgi:hypothetical protein
MPPILVRNYIHQMIVAPLAVVFLLCRDPIVPRSVEGMPKLSFFQQTSSDPNRQNRLQILLSADTNCQVIHSLVVLTIILLSKHRK